MTAADHSLVESLAEHIAHAGWIKFREMNDFLESRGISTDVGGQELTGAHVKQAHIWPTTVLLGPTSREYIEIVEGLFSSYPITLMIGDVADFYGDEPWWVTWIGPPPVDNVASRTYPAVNPYVHEIADRVKYAFAVSTRILAEMQYRLAELAGRGQLDRDESFALQEGLIGLWDEVYFGTLFAVRDQSTPDTTWDEADNTYSDGRQVVNQIRIEPVEESDDCWEHNRCMLDDGAPREFPLGTITYIAPNCPEVVWSDDEVGRSAETLTDRLERHGDE